VRVLTYVGKYEHCSLSRRGIGMNEIAENGLGVAIIILKKGLYCRVTEGLGFHCR
jgi:hypothetical protein